jgi:hypothetical protein
METKHVTAEAFFINVLGQRVKVEIIKGLTFRGDECEGMCQPSERVIQIDDSLRCEPLRFERVLVHETFHMAVRLAGMNELIDLPTEEAMAVLVESVFTSPTKLRLDYEWSDK